MDNESQQWLSIMKESDFISPAGKLIEDPSGEYEYFLPDPPPRQIDIDAELNLLNSEAERNIGMLSGVGATLPNPHILIRPYLTREAVLSSKIEGTQASLSELLRYQAQGERSAKRDEAEVYNYIRALEYGLEKIKTSEIDFDLIKELHRILLTGVRGKNKTPGEFRNVQVWIGEEGTSRGESTFVPPAPVALIKPMHDFMDYISEKDIPLLIQTALMHYHFETTHPFLDGNGRIGRLLITLFLCKRGVLSKPLLYLSAYFEKNKAEYYKKLLEVSQKGDYASWIKFFLRGVKEQSEDGKNRALSLVRLRENYRSMLSKERSFPKASMIIDKIFENPFISVIGASLFLNVTYPTAKRTISSLQRFGLLTEADSHVRRRKMYYNPEILKILGI